VIAVSEELRQEAARYWPDALTKTQVVVNAIDLDLIQAAKPMLHPRRYIAAVGRLVWEKDFATLIRAYANIQEEIGDMGLVIAGEGTQDATLREIAQTCRRPDHVTFLGKVEREEAISVIKGSEFLVLPSITEGFPIVVLEALAMGKAVVGTRIPGIQEMIEDGRQGNLFPVGDHIALSRLLRTYCHQPGYLVERSAAAASVNLDSYDIHKSALRHLQVFEASG
jgi:glycosyltransferase involved in cell wall biosynthesis